MGLSKQKPWQPEQVLILDGAMGTMLQARGMQPGECPEALNLTRPELVQGIHADYVAAGADLIQTNTFGANRHKLRAYGREDEVVAINQAGVRLVRAVVGDKARVVVSVGPTGLLSEPYGTTDFDTFYHAFAEQAEAAAAAGADLISLETMSDLQEIRAALIAVKEKTGLPVLAQMTFEPEGRTVMGTDPTTAAVVLEALGAEVIGANCSGGPAELYTVLAEMAQATHLPLVVQPNAGLPTLVDGQTVFKQTPASMAEWAQKFRDLGVWIIGGCCGTTPAHIQALNEVLRGQKGVLGKKRGGATLSSRSRTIRIDDTSPFAFIGERINPTARKKLAADIREGRMQMVLEEARTQVEAGTPILDVNMGVPGIDEAVAMHQAVIQIQGSVDVPLSLDSANPAAIEAGLKAFAGKALINSVNGEEKSLRTILPLARRYGAAVLGLTLDEQGIPATAEARLAIAKRIVETAEAYGLAREDVYIDCLVQTASAQQVQVQETLRGVQLVKQTLGVRTMLGVSNVSHGLPAREVLNAAFLTMALGFGLDLAILNPFDARMREALMASAVLLNRDPYCGAYIEKFKAYTPSSSIPPGPSQTSDVVHRNAPAEAVENEGLTGVARLKDQIQQTIINGNREQIQPLLQAALDAGLEPLALVNEAMIPGIEEVGRRYEDKSFFLPQLILGAETMKAGFTLLRPLLSSGANQEKGKIVLATVQGDVHDIGKNIVAVMLENYGFGVIDLGKDVPNQKIIETAIQEKADLIGLSALMTTTMPRMAEVIAEIQKQGLPTRVIIGGAVVTQDYADKIGADAYAPDARAGVLSALGLVGAK